MISFNYFSTTTGTPSIWQNTGDRPAILKGVRIDYKVLGSNEPRPIFDGPLADLREQELRPNDKIDRSAPPMSAQESQRMFGRPPIPSTGLPAWSIGMRLTQKSYLPRRHSRSSQEACWTHMTPTAGAQTDISRFSRYPLLSGALPSQIVTDKTSTAIPMHHCLIYHPNLPVYRAFPCFFFVRKVHTSHFSRMGCFSF